jgi:PhnB protein
MAIINPYINFNGNAEEAFNFYKSVFGGEFEALVRFKDLESAEFSVPENEGNKIMRITLPIGDNTLLANDVPASMGPVSETENRSKIAISAKTQGEADKLFKGLSEGGAVEMPLAESPWGTHFAMFRDKYGIEWTVEFDPAQEGHTQ